MFLPGGKAKELRNSLISFVRAPILLVNTLTHALIFSYRPHLIPSAWGLVFNVWIWSSVKRSSCSNTLKYRWTKTRCDPSKPFPILTQCDVTSNESRLGIVKSLLIVVYQIPISEAVILGVFWVEIWSDSYQKKWETGLLMRPVSSHQGIGEVGEGAGNVKAKPC